MLTPFDLIKGFLSFKSYFTCFLIATTIFGLFVFFKRKLSPTQQSTTSWKGYLTYFLIIIGILSFIYLCFFHKTEPSSKYAGQLVNKIDKAIDKYENTINNYKGLKTNWESELKKCEDELKELYNAQESSQKQKEQIHELLEQNETKIKEIKEQLKNTTGNITILKGKLTQLEKDKEDNERNIKATEEQIKNTTDNVEMQKLRKRLEELRTQEGNIIKQISEIKSEIEGLESKYSLYSEQIRHMEDLKQDLEKRYDTLNNDEKSFFNSIKSKEKIQSEIKTNIYQITKKLEEIKLEKDLYTSLKIKYREMHNRMQTYEKEHEASAGNIVKWGFKAFDKVTDLIPAKYGMKIMGKAVTFTRKFAQGMSKATLVLHEGHRLWHLYNEVAQENKEHPPMITEEALKMYTQDIDRDLAKLDADYKDYEKKLEEYNNRIEQDKLGQELQNSEKLIKNNKDEFKSWIIEYKKITDELIQQRKKIIGINELNKNEYNLTLDLEKVQDEKAIIEDEYFRQRNPNYARAQQRLQARRVGKIPEMVMIPNKK
ncbi:DNA double-strand break repair Rad50 ATPase [Candidatus Phytoplasma luffae]|uniref:DNA double-strand break repair Rad50 ATPase n=1 Tax=Loofah witches'-broom phytoplasma TaxID=35773 RepID=A0A975IMH1_LOWBP|nr:DNA double-strand break repair protein Rad50 [Candidatus Phytoplasma luffae]QTX02604.1 DNA double-strand break repair Rad50 ATPase [Candidatus Phytoplasma luffae]QTX03154.1 DNA double-strand break repair Rad50 ATPase [Candidatus Phytoplasma luffae]